MDKEEIERLLEESIEQLYDGREPRGLYEPIKYVLSVGGKRLRPRLLLMACDAFGGDARLAMNAALAIEVFHNFTLVHDDIMDRASMRRGMPTVHVKWDESTAILSGDAMLSEAYDLLCGLETDNITQILKLFNQTVREVYEGQQYDMDFEKRIDVPVGEYVSMIRLKTAVLLAASLKMGAMIAGARANDADLIYKYGIGIGLAFQIKDDLLDVYGDAAKFGKNIGGDILCNKKTFLLTSALETENEEKKRELTEWIEKKDAEPQEKIKAVTAIYNALGVKQRAELAMRKHYDDAMTALEETTLGESQKRVFETIAKNLLYRED